MPRTEVAAPLAGEVNDITQLYGITVNEVVGESRDTSEQLYHTLNRVGRGDPVTSDHEPTTDIGRLAYELSMLRETKKAHMTAASCPESEPWFLRSLGCAEQGTKGYKPAIIHLDPEGQPIAYTKNRGHLTTLVLRQSVFLGDVPAGTIARPRGLDLSGELISAQIRLRRMDSPSRLDVARPSTFSLSAELLEACQYDPSDMVTDGRLITQAKLVAATSIKDIVERVDNLARNA